MATLRTAPVGLGLGILLLTLATAAIHLYMGLSWGNTLFTLNGLGYLGLLAVLQLPIPPLRRFRGVARSALIGYTALTIVLYFVEAPGMAIGSADKAIEVALVALLLADAYRARYAPAGVSGARDGRVTVRPEAQKAAEAMRSFGTRR